MVTMINLSFRSLVIPLVSLLLWGCEGTPRTIHDFCLLSNPIRPTKQDVTTMSAPLVSQVLLHNTQGEQICGWGK